MTNLQYIECLTLESITVRDHAAEVALVILGNYYSKKKEGIF